MPLDKGKSAFTLPKLPYAEDALAPVISAKTISFHYGKHHKAYVDKTNELIANTELADKDLEEIVRAAARQKDKPALFNNAAQAWNHDFLWHSMSPKGGVPTGVLADRIKQDLGGFETFATAFKAAAVGQFGSGWAWLVLDGRTLRIVTTNNADTPIVHGQRPLLAIDVWEHAYYLDYHEKRPEHLQAVITHLLNWDFATRNFEST
jgi:Fe-Mn family superoxide dismutase